MLLYIYVTIIVYKNIYIYSIRNNNNIVGISQAAILQNGTVYEKAGVNITTMSGALPKTALLRMRSDHKSLQAIVDQLDSNHETLIFSVAGISLVLHPHNPKIPTVHANYRIFQIIYNEKNITWFGGGSDLTPAYVNEDDAKHFHNILKYSCDINDKNYQKTQKSSLYPRFKKWCDEYFYIPHRDETRGIGGIFFDDLDENNIDMNNIEIFNFIQTCGNYFSASYFPIVRAHIFDPFTPEEKRFQQVSIIKYY